MEAKLGNNPSWVWRTIWEGRKILTAGLRWSIGNGASVRIDDDPWIPKPGPFVPRRIVDDDDFVTADQLINPNTKAWKEDVVNRLFESDQVACILNIPISRTNESDKLVWHISHIGNYTANSGYMVAMDRLPNSRAGGTTSTEEIAEKWWRHLWQLNIPRKIQLFVWKYFHEIYRTPASNLIHDS